jgi:hypothetical protein
MHRHDAASGVMWGMAVSPGKCWAVCTQALNINDSAGSKHTALQVDT